MKGELTNMFLCHPPSCSSQLLERRDGQQEEELCDLLDDPEQFQPPGHPSSKLSKVLDHPELRTSGWQEDLLQPQCLVDAPGTQEVEPNL